MNKGSLCSRDSRMRLRRYGQSERVAARRSSRSHQQSESASTVRRALFSPGLDSLTVTVAGRWHSYAPECLAWHSPLLSRSARRWPPESAPAQRPTRQTRPRSPLSMKSKPCPASANSAKSPRGPVRLPSSSVSPSRTRANAQQQRHRGRDSAVVVVSVQLLRALGEHQGTPIARQAGSLPACTARSCSASSRSGKPQPRAVRPKAHSHRDRLDRVRGQEDRVAQREDREVALDPLAPVQLPALREERATLLAARRGLASRPHRVDQTVLPPRTDRASRCRAGPPTN